MRVIALTPSGKRRGKVHEAKLVNRDGSLPTALRFCDCVYLGNGCDLGCCQPYQRTTKPVTCKRCLKGRS